MTARRLRSESAGDRFETVRDPGIKAFCPNCWTVVSFSLPACPRCGADLSALSGREYAVKLLGALDHPVTEVRERAALLLGAIAGPEAYEPLRRRARSSLDPFVAAAALQGLFTLLQRHPSLPTVDWRSFMSPERPFLVRIAAEEILATEGGE